jgi:hypothetical protein
MNNNKEKDYSSFYEIDDDGVVHFLKTWENGKDFDDLEKELPIMFDLIGIELVKWKIKNEYPTEQIPYKKDYYRKPLFHFGDEIVIGDSFHYKVEYLSNEKSLSKSRMLWARNNGTFNLIKLDRDVDVDRIMSEIKN